MSDEISRLIPIGRRAFLRDNALVLTAATVLPSPSWADGSDDALRIGLMTDLHYADKPTAGSRHYRETPDKLAVATSKLAVRDLDFVVELGDFIDAADSVKTELNHLSRINRDFSNICERRHYVLGNHCVHTLTKREFLDGVEQPKSFYSFDAGDFHFVTLDSCFRSDGQPYGRMNFQWTDPNIPPHEIEWLRADLEATTRPTIVLAHQRLDVDNHYGVNNAVAVRQVLEESGRVLAVFQGHSHKNDYHHLGGIHYCTLVAMVEGSGEENNAFSLMRIADSGDIRIEGFLKQKDYMWKS